MRFLLPILVLVAFVELWAQAPIKSDHSSQGKAVIHVLRANQDGEVVAESVASPLFAFRAEQGSVDSAGILQCTQSTEKRELNGVSYPVVVLECGDAKLALVGVDLTVKR